jgi:hypothetical protein
MRLTPVANVIKLFFNIITLCITSVKIIGKYAANGVNYAQQVFLILAPVANVIKFFQYNHTAIGIT